MGRSAHGPAKSGAGEPAKFRRCVKTPQLSHDMERAAGWPCAVDSARMARARDMAKRRQTCSSGHVKSWFCNIPAPNGFYLTARRRRPSTAASLKIGLVRDGPWKGI
jgi:hypothetical protein